MTSPDTEFIRILGAAPGATEAQPPRPAAKAPSVLPILGLSDIVIFPGMVAPLLVDTAQSIRLIDDVVEGDRLLGLVLQRKPELDTPTPEEYKATLSELRSWLGPVHVFFSGGEALLRPYTTDLLAHASSAGLYAEILTHGYWDDQSRIEKVALANPGRVTVSLDGIGEAHTLIWGREKFFEKTVRTLETLRRVRADAHPYRSRG